MPECCMSEPKEPFFFECEYEKGLSFYQQKYFAHYKDEPYIGEARHRNLYLPHVPKRIAEVNPRAKLLLILRNPTERAFSHWWHAHSRGYDSLSFEKAIDADLERIAAGKLLTTEQEIATYCSVEDHVTFYRTYVDSGYYLQQLERYLELFPREQLKIVLTEDLNRNPGKTIKELRAFLELTDAYTPTAPETVANRMKKREAGKRTHRLVRSTGIQYLLPASTKQWIYQFYNRKMLSLPRISSKMKRLLNNHYEPHNAALSEFMQRDLSHWNE